MTQANTDMKKIWDRVVYKVKHQIIHPTLWRSLEMAVPVTIEDDEFVVGFSAANLHMSGHLNSGEHKNAIEKALKEFSGIHLRLKLIEGDTLQDWAQVKEKEARIQELKEDARLRQERDNALSKSWDSLLETIGRRYAATPLRQLPQARAKYLAEMIKLVSDTMDVLIPDEAAADEIAHRSLARAIEKVGQLIETPGTIIALELLRFRSRK